MTIAAAMADAFYREFLEHGRVFAVRDEDGFPAPKNQDGQRAAPFWSRRSRAEKVVATVPAYADLTVVEIAEDEWLERWLPGLEADGLLVGLNWSGKRAMGYDLSVADLRRNLEARRAAQPDSPG